MEGADSEKTDDEVAQLKTVYQKNCRVMKTVGDFTYVISIQLPEQNVQLKFQLTASYPQDIPGIVTLSPDLSSDCLDQLNAFLIEKANESIGKSMIQDLVKEGISWLGINSVTKVSDVEKKNTKTSRTKKKSKQGKKDVNAENHCEKKPSMRTAVDVISRIQWDESLITEDFLVGYLDRFSGIEEKPFSAFSWEDVASVDYHTLAIPKHRICYFKYKTVKVWDKAQRLDHVFGSTGDKISLTDVIKNYKYYQEELPSIHDQTFSCESLTSSLPDVDLDLSDDLQNADTRANFFIALRIMDEEVVARVTKLQYSILQEVPAYKDYGVQPSLLHVTLCALSLKTADQIATAVQILEDSRQELLKIVQFASPLQISDVKHFSNRVLYTSMDATPQLVQLTDLLKSRFQTKGFLHVDRHETFQPHVTFFKLNKAVMRENEVETINQQICERYSGYKFGKQNLDNLHLCSMDNVRQEDGFYKCCTTIPL